MTKQSRLIARAEDLPPPRWRRLIPLRPTILLMAMATEPSPPDPDESDSQAPTAASLADIVVGQNPEIAQVFGSEVLAQLDSIRPTLIDQSDPGEVDLSRESFNAHGLGIMAAAPCEMWRLPDGPNAEDRSRQAIQDLLDLSSSSP